jgi:hypothetical protein
VDVPPGRDELDRACAATESPAALRAALDDLSWSLLDATLSEVARPVLARAAQLAARHQAALTPEHQRLLAALNRVADLSPLGGEDGHRGAGQGIRISS